MLAAVGEMSAASEAELLSKEPSSREKQTSTAMSIPSVTFCSVPSKPMLAPVNIYRILKS